MMMGEYCLADDKRPVYPREIHQRTIPREATRQGIFRTLPEGSISDRGRKLAGSSVSEYRVYDEAAQTASQIMSWSRAFDKPPTPPAWHIGLSKLWTPTGAIASPPQRGLTFHRHQSYGDADPTLSAGQI